MIRKVERWLKRDGNSIVKLACLMNYKTTNTINHWQVVESVPMKARKRLKKILEGKITLEIKE